MLFASPNTFGEINCTDVSRAIFNFLSLEVVKKTTFIVVSAALLTVIVVQCGTSYTPTIDVFVYCFVYSAWITVCLPWLVQNLTGKLLGMLIGVIFRLFAVDVGVLAWSAFRGHRNILQRGLRMRPLFEPSMSWLAEAGYNLRYGVVISAIVASVISLLIDFYEKIYEDSQITKRPNTKRKSAWLSSAAYKPCKTVRANRNSVQQYPNQEYEDPEYRESKNSKLGTTVRFNITDNIAEPINITGDLKNGQGEFPECNQYMTGRTSDAESEDDRTQKEVHTQEQHFGSFSEGKPKTVHTPRVVWRDAENLKKSSPKDNVSDAAEFRPFCSFPECSNIGIVNADRISGADLDEWPLVSTSQTKGKLRGKRGEFITSSETHRSKTLRHSDGSTRRDHVTKTSDEIEKVKNERTRHKDAMEEALNESLRGLRKLRGKI